MLFLAFYLFSFYRFWIWIRQTGCWAFTEKKGWRWYYREVKLSFLLLHIGSKVNDLILKEALLCWYGSQVCIFVFLCFALFCHIISRIIFSFWLTRQLKVEKPCQKWVEKPVLTSFLLVSYNSISLTLSITEELPSSVAPLYHLWT